MIFVVLFFSDGERLFIREDFNFSGFATRQQFLREFIGGRRASAVILLVVVMEIRGPMPFVFYGHAADDKLKILVADAQTFGPIYMRCMDILKQNFIVMD